MASYKIFRRPAFVSLACMLSLFAIACGQDKYNESGSPPAPPDITQAVPPMPDRGDNEAPGEAPGQQAAPARIEQQIIRTGTLEVKVDELDSAEAAATRLATANGGYVANSSRAQYTGTSRTGTMQLRIPSAKFDSVFAALRALGMVTQEQIGTTDVTQEYIDLEARLRTQKELETRLLTLLNEKSGKLADVIAVEEKLAAVRSQIETIQGQLRYMQDRISMSTVTLTLYEPGAVGSSGETFGGRMERAFSDGLDGLVELVGGGITAVIALLPIIVGGVLIYLFVVRPLRRRARARKERARSTPVPEK